MGTSEFRRVDPEADADLSVWGQPLDEDEPSSPHEEEEISEIEVSIDEDVAASGAPDGEEPADVAAASAAFGTTVDLESEEELTVEPAEPPAAALPAPPADDDADGWSIDTSELQTAAEAAQELFTSTAPAEPEPEPEPAAHAAQRLELDGTMGDWQAEEVFAEPPARSATSKSLRAAEALAAQDGRSADEEPPAPRPPTRKTTAEQPPTGETTAARPPTGEVAAVRLPSGETMAARPPTGEAAAVEPAPRPEPRPPARIDPLPLDKALASGDRAWLQDYNAFKAVTQKFARLGGWQKVAACTGHAIVEAGFASGATRTAMLLDLARIYRDRLNDTRRAEQAFAALAQEDPGNAEALAFLSAAYEERGDFGAIYDLYITAVEATWDPNERLEWTRKAAEIATERAKKVDLAIKAWEHLWHLGDAQEEATRELTTYYRMAERWSEMGAFLSQRADRQEGPAQLVTLRELAEVKLSGERAAGEASKVLERIVAHSHQDPIATLQLARVYAQREDWSALESLAAQAASDQVHAKAALDLLQLVADALWRADRLEQAVEIYNRILEVDPANHDGTTRKRDYLIRAGKHEELIAVLLSKADSTDDDDQQAALLAEAATLADEQLDDTERAIKLWERRIIIDPEHLSSFEALARLYERSGDHRGLGRALQGQLSLTKELPRRIDLLRRLGDHYARKMEDDERAEGCWKEILGLDPTDLPVREELIELHRRRADYEALNSALMRQIWLTSDEARAEKLCRLAAENLDANFEDAQRSIEGWRRVLDFAPRDRQALEALAEHYGKLDQHRELIAALEQQIRATDSDPQHRAALALQIADLWRAAEVHRAAVATYERVLRWDPVNPPALDGAIAIYQAHDQLGLAFGVIDQASVLTADAGRRITLLRRNLDLFAPEQRRARFYQLRRILALSYGVHEILGQLKAEAEAQEDPSLWPEFAALLVQLIGQQDDPGARLELRRELALICEKRLEDRPRAFLALQTALLIPEPQSLLGEMTRLAHLTRRFEDLLALLDRLTTPEYKLGERKKVILQRAQLCEKNLDDPLRALSEHRRLLALDPVDWEPLAEIDRLAQAHGFWHELDALLAEMWDRTTSNRDRVDLLVRREAISRERLESRPRAFELLVRRFRLEPENVDVLRALTEDAEALGAWGWLLPLLEAAQLAPQETRSAHELSVTAALYEDKLEDLDRAFVLYAESFVMDPSVAGLPEKLEELAGKIGRYDALADTFRMAAASTTDREQTLALLRHIAVIYEDKLQQPDRAIDIHRRLLDLKQDEMRSLDVMIAWHRERGQWRDLRDRLHQWVHLAPPDEGRVDKLLEIARISQEHLADPEAALGAYGTVLELDPEHTDARAGLDGLVESILDPALRLRWLRMQLGSAAADEAVKLRLEIANIQREDLQDIDGAVATLQSLVEDSGSDGPGFAPLRELLIEGQRHRPLVQLLKSRADQLSDPAAQLESLDEAVATCHEHLAGREPELHEALYRAVLALRPTDRTVRVRLARLLRGAGRFDDLCELLEDQLGHAEDTADALAIRYQLTRLLALNLDRLPEAEAHWEEIVTRQPEEEGALLALARAARTRGDIPRYVELRHKQAKILPAVEGALVLCHLAETCDEAPALEEKMVAFYREARALDPDNVPAMEALKGIGRRLKSLRPAAALLPFDGERDLDTAQRAQRLKALGDRSADAEPAAALDWLRRAVAVDPDYPDAWEALAAALERGGDAEGVFRAGRSWLQALERTEALDLDRLRAEAERLYVLALSARAADLEEVYGRLIRQAYELVPQHAPAALAWAEALVAEERIAEAHELLAEILLHNREDLSDEQRVAAHYARGTTLRRLDRRDEAIDDFREALHIAPLDARCLVSMGEAQSEAGRVAAALECLIRSLVVVQDTEQRARLFYRIGVLWEDGISNSAEAGACYEAALNEGMAERDLLHRALRHYQRTGRLDESLEVVDGLLPTAEDPEELATLWQVRGEIFAARDDGQDEAIEAFDMALSYDPSRQGARDGLTMVLEQRADWDQLLQVLEASCDVGTPEQRAQALQRMADICTLALSDAERAEGYLRASVEAMPTRQALEQLERIYAERSDRASERLDVLGLLVGFGPPWMERSMELAKLLLADDDKSWAWALLSPLLGVSQIDPDLKSLLQTMRKDFERAPLRCPADDEAWELARHPLATPALSEVLAVVEEVVHPLGTESVDSAGDGGAIAISPQSVLGKAFAAVLAKVGMSCTLHRTQDLPEAICIVNSRPDPAIVVRTEIVQQLVHAEVGFLFGAATTLCRPGFRGIAALPADGREQLICAVFRAAGLGEAGGKRAAKLEGRIRESVEPEVLKHWAELLAPLSGTDPLELGRRYWRGVQLTARRIGLLAGADLRQAFRVVARLEEEVPRPRVVARLEELDETIAAAEALQDMIAFTSSPTFGKLLSGAVVAELG